MDADHLRASAQALEERLEGKRIGLLYPDPPPFIAAVTRTHIAEVLSEEKMMTVDLPFSSVEHLLRADFRQAIDSCNMVCKIVHGSLNRSGVIQSILEYQNMPYTGQSLQTDLLSQNKLFVKSIMHSHNIPTPRYWQPDNRRTDDVPAEIESQSSGWVAKPVDTNGSDGIVYLRDRAELHDFLDGMQSRQHRYFIEEYCPGRVMTVGVIPAGTALHTTAPMEYVLHEGCAIMDADWKQKPERIAPADVPSATAEIMELTAASLHRAIGAEGVSRSDFILDTQGRIQTLEINTNVGLSRIHDVPTALGTSRERYRDLVLAHLGTALSKFPQQHGNF
ncbi:MAG: ATP-grasp domain-containing protein [Candidatus Peribacteraceae bacterium]|nr:ATP-grasp domain-containing protein [Candidatus Peribacteraceae bacterium]MDD5074686.1 ATP-grasp domain-containing protein [Candidatus Peribacteraceae bacterium]